MSLPLAEFVAALIFLINVIVHVNMVSSFTASSSPSTSVIASFTSSSSEESSSISYKLREFDASRDLDALHDICRTVYGGSDYLPKTAPTLASDPNSSFLVAADAVTDRPAAVGNARRFKPNMSWLEAIRTCEKHRSRGLARHLTQSLIDVSRNEHGCEVYSCTVESNIAMQRVFERVGMMLLGQIHQCSFDELKRLPGWGAGDGSDIIDNRLPLPLLQSLGVESSIEDENEAMQNMEATTVNSEQELSASLQHIMARGGIGHLVGLYELLPNEAIHDGLEAGRLWKVSSNSNGAAEDTKDIALVAFVKEEKISSLRSPWVCSISATSVAILEEALWFACSSSCLDKLDGHVAFTVAFDCCNFPLVDTKSFPPAIKALPLTEDACLLFGSSKDL